LIFFTLRAMSNSIFNSYKLKSIAKFIPDLFYLGVIWILGIALVNPIGDFPLNDDFSYGRTVYNLSELGVFLFDDWLGMSLFTQVLWGTIFTKIFGFSFTVLRFSTLTLAYIALASCYLLARDLGADRKLSLLVALSIGFSPIFFSLSYTFMTDIPFFSFLILSVYFFHRFLQHERLSTFFAAILLGVAAILIRQLGLMLPIAFLLTYVIRIIYFGKCSLRSLLVAVTPLVISVVAYLLYREWFMSLQGLPENYDSLGRLSKRLNKDFWLGSMQRIGVIITYLGMFLLPLLFGVGRFRYWNNKRIKGQTILPFQEKIISGIFVFLLACIGVGIAHVFWGNIFNGIALGPTLLKDGQHFSNIPKFTTSQGNFVKSLFFGAGILFILSILPVLFKSLNKRNPQFLSALFAAMNILVYCGFLMLETLFFDRYLIQLFPFVLILFFVVHKEWNAKYQLLAFFVLFGMTCYSIAGTHDYLAWHRAKKEALEYLTEEMKIPTNQIDGGFEFNGWHRKPGQKKWVGGKSPWWVEKDYYAVTFGDIKNYKRIKHFPFTRWLPLQQDSLFIMEVKYR